MSPLQAGTEDRDQEIAPSAEGQNWDFGHEASGALDEPALSRDGDSGHFGPE